MVEKKGAFVDAEEVPGVAVLDGKAYACVPCRLRMACASPFLFHLRGFIFDWHRRTCAGYRALGAVLPDCCRPRPAPPGSVASPDGSPG